MLYRLLKKFKTHFPIINNKDRVIIGKGSSFGFNTVINADGKFVKIGDNCHFEVGVYLRLWDGDISIGDNVFVGPYSVLYGHNGLSIGSNVLIASHVTLIPANHNFSNKELLIKDQGLSGEGIVIEDNVWIATGVTVLQGVTIGKGSIIAAGAIVNKNVPEYSIYGGVPARLIKNY